MRIVGEGIRKLREDKMALVCLAIFLVYGLVALLAQFGVLAADWNTRIGESYAAPSFESIRHWWGLDIFGRSVLDKVLHGTRIAMTVGLVASVISVVIGVILGAIAGYFGGKVDDFVVWFFTTVSSIPGILLLMGIAWVLERGLLSVCIAIGSTSWVGLCRVIRAEFMKHKNREYVVAASSLGIGHGSKIFRHILPNVTHQIIINFSLMFQSAIKSEVILSYLGLGVQNQPSWGVMIDDARLELARGVWWQLGAATVFMFVLVLALNLLGDALRDALDPRL